MIMSKSILAVFLALAIAVTPATAFSPEKCAQRKATHLITFTISRTNEDGEVETGSEVCTATALGPHALLTAAHCDGGETSVQIDNVPVGYNILGRIVDGEDHEIFLVDGPAFKDTIERFYVPVARVKVGDSVFMWGDGGALFPPLFRRGYYMGRVTQKSEDVIAGRPTGDVLLFDMSIIEGDSGSAVYDKHGNLLTLVTYIYGKYMGAYPLAFTEEEILLAENF